MPHDTRMPVLRQRPTPTAHTPLALTPPAPATHHPLRSLRPGVDAGPVRSLYIHVPFCSHKCHYCDFYSLVDTRDRQPAFVDRLIAELRDLAPFAAGAPLRTVFIGGGTPSLLHAPLWRRLLDALHDLFDLSALRAADAEFTVECNPESASRELLDTLAAAGVNRVSLGAQSFSPRHLATLERRHDPANVARAVAAARAAGIPRLSLDLIFAVPGQSPADFERDLLAALDLSPSHLSAYALTYEPNTAMTARLRRGEFLPCDPDLEADLYELALATLHARGLERYEISNFARPGDECRHNLAYWRQEQWLAAGPSASAHVAGHRWKNAPRLDDYLASPPGLAPFIDHEPPDPRRALAERLMTGLRLREGVARADTLARAAALDPPADAALARAARTAADSSLLRAADAPRWSLTDRGLLLADRVAADFIAALDPVSPRPGPRARPRAPAGA